MSSPLPFDPIAEAARHWEGRWGTDAARAMSAITSVMRAEQILIARLNSLLEPHDLTFPRYEALMLLLFSRRGALPLGKIGDRLQVHRTSVTNLIDGLEASGFVRRSRHESDRRTTLAAITDPGREAAEAATATLNEELFGTAPLDADQLTALTELLAEFRAVADGFPAGRPVSRSEPA
jgi:DNA-binding MarR family transcriptional regulator